MKMTTNKRVKFILMLTLIIAVLAVGEIRPQSKISGQSEFPDNAIETLKTGINSDNLGLRRSSIYFAGKYRISETKETLMKLMEKEPDPNTKILIALVLFKIGDPDGLDLVRESGDKEAEIKVRNMCRAIYKEYLMGKLGEYASLIDNN